jgi:CRISPR/Cas system-associated exonuclease Cas4 (RecB family)
MPSIPRRPGTTDPDVETPNNFDFTATGMGDDPVPIFLGGPMRELVPRPHWSYSSVSQYLKCPLQYYFERVVKLPRETRTAAQVLGSAVHSALADYHRKLQAGESVTAQQVHRAYLAAWDAQADDGPIIGSGGKPVGDSRDLGLALVDVYLDEPPPESIIAVESPFLAPIANSHGEYLERPVLVVADLVVRQGDSLLVNEIKTAGRSFSESEVATSHQPTFYANALYEITGEEPAVEYTVLVKTKQPKVQKIRAVRTTSDYQRLGDIIEAVERGVGAGLFYPVETPLNCSGCPFYRPCREWTGHQTRDEVIHSESQEAARC